MDPAGMNALREATAKRMSGMRGKGPGPGGSKHPKMPHQEGDDGPSFNPAGGFDGMANIPNAEGLGMPPSATAPKMDPPLTSHDFASLAGPSLGIYAVLTFIPTMAIFQLIYNFYFQESYFGGMNFYKLLFYALTGQLSKKMGLPEAQALAEAAKANQANGGSKIPLNPKTGKPLNPTEEYANITAKAKLVSAVLRSRRHEYHGLTDDEYLRACVSEATSNATGGRVGSRKGAAAAAKEKEANAANGKTRVKAGSGMLSFLDEEEAAARSNIHGDAEVKCENLAIFIGVNTDETPLALEDAEKLANRVFKDPQRPTGPNGSYRSCFFGCQGDATTAGNDPNVNSHQRVFVKPTSANLMALITDIATCRVRQWANIVVYIAAPVRAAPTGWLDDGLVRDESTNYIHRSNFLRPDLVTTITDKDGYYLNNCFVDAAGDAKKGAPKPSADDGSASPFPKFTLEFLGDISEPCNELSWVDLNLFLTRLREAVLESSRLQEVAAMASKGMIAEANAVSAARFRTTGTNIVLMLDAAYRPEGAHESVDFITNTQEGFYCDPTVGLSDADRKNRAASEAKLNAAQQNSIRLTIEVNEKPLFAPPAELMDTLASLSLHEAVAYGMMATLTPFTNFTVLVAPRRNYYVEKAVRQGLQKAAWALDDPHNKKEILIKTPAAALASLMVTKEPNTAKSLNPMANLAPPALPSPNNPRLVGFSDFVRCFMEGYFSAMAHDGKVPTADVALDKLNDPTASLVAPGIRGSVDNSAFWCGRMTVASTALFLGRHPQMMGFADVVLPAADGSTMMPISSGMSMASTASPGAKVPTTSTPLIAFYSRGVMNDATLFSQMSLAPRGAPSAISPPLLLMPSQKHLRHCEEVLVPSMRTAIDGSCFHAVSSEVEQGCTISSVDLNPTLQAIGWNGDLLRHFTDGIHFFNVPILVANPSLAAVEAQSGALGLSTDRYVDLLAQHLMMRLAGSLMEHAGHSHFGTVPSFAEAIRVLTVMKEQAIMTIVFLNAPTAVGAGRTAATDVGSAVWVRALDYLHDVFKGAEPKPSGEARISIILVPAPSVEANAALVLPQPLEAVIGRVTLPSPSLLDVKTAFRSKWVLPFATGAASDFAQLHTLYSNTFGAQWPNAGIFAAIDAEAGVEGAGGVPVELLGKREGIDMVVGAISGSSASSAAVVSTVSLIEEAAKDLVPSSLISLGKKDAESSNAAALYQSLPEAFIAPLLRYLVLTKMGDAKAIDTSSYADIVGAVAAAVLTPTAVARRVAPTTDATSTALVLKSLYRTILATSSAATLNAVTADGTIRIPTAVAFGAFDDMLQSQHVARRGGASSSAKPQFARVWTLFHDTLGLLGFSGLVMSHSIANCSTVSQLYSPSVYAAMGTCASEAAAALRSDSNTDSRLYAALFDDLQPFIELNPLVTMDVLAAMAGERAAPLAREESLRGALRSTTFRNTSLPVTADGKEERLLFATIAGHRMRFSQTSLWTRYIAGADAAISVVEHHLASGASTVDAAASQALGVVCYDVLDTLFVSNAAQLMPLLNVLALVKRCVSLLTVIADKEATLKAFVSAPSALLKEEDVVAGLRRARGYAAACGYGCGAVGEDGSVATAAVMAPSAGEWWLHLAHTSELLDGNVGRPITADHLAAARKKAVAENAPAIDEYKFEDDAPAKKADAEEGPEGRNKDNTANDVDPRLRDGGCPIVPITVNRPSTAVATTMEALRAVISQERPPRVQFMQLYEREDLGGDEPNTIEELDSDADEDDVAELNARLATQEVRRRAAVEANQAGILLASDSPVTEGGKCYYRGSTKDALMLVATGGALTYPWADKTQGTLPSAASCLSYVDGKLYVGHVDGRITVCEADTSKIVAALGPDTHNNAPVTDVIPYGRSYTDIGNHNYYYTYASGIKANPDDEDPAAGASGGDQKVSTAIVTASKSNRCIRLWPSNAMTDEALASGAVEQLAVLDNTKAMRVKDPMSRCFYARLCRRGVDEVQLRQNIGNPEELTNRRRRDLMTLLMKTANKGRKGAADEPLDEDEMAVAAAVAPILAKAKAVTGANDTVLIMYGASAQGTQHVAEERFNDNAFIGTDGVWQYTMSLTVPLGYEVTAATVGPATKGEARVAVAVSSLTDPEVHYVQQFEIARSR